MSQMSYGEPQPTPAPSRSQVSGTNVMAILSLVFAFVFAPLGIVFGHIAKRQIRRTGEQGSGLATAGLVLGYIFTILMVVAWIILAVAIANDPGTTPT